MPELLSLDGLQLNNSDSGGAYTLTRMVNNPPKKRPEWQERNDGDGAGLLRDPFVENRTIEATVEIRSSSRDASQAALGVLVDKVEEAEATPGGSSLVWRPEGSTRALTYVVLTGELAGPEITVETGYFAPGPLLKVELTLTCKPYGYESKVTGPTASSASPIVLLSIPSVGGDVQAEAELIVTDAAGQQRDFVAWGLEQRYQAGNDLLLTSDQLTTSGTSGALTSRGGSVSTQVIRATLNESPVAVAATGNQPHVGTFNVYLRGYLGTNNLASTVRGVRLTYRVGDGPLKRLPWVIPSVYNTFCELNLGAVTIPLTPVGGQRWQGFVEAYSETIGDTFDVDYLEPMPTMEGFGKARRTTPFSALGTVGASYPVGTGSGSLTGKALTVGGTWGNAAGDSDDWQVTGTNIIRGTASDSTFGRGLIAGTTSFTDTIWQFAYATEALDVAGSNSPQVTAVARWVDWNNCLMMRWRPSSGIAELMRLTVWNGTSTFAWTPIAQGFYGPAQPNAVYGIRVQVSTDGRVTGWVWPWWGTTPPSPVVMGSHPDLKFGGSLSSGRVGMLDWSGSTTFINRHYSSFAGAGIGGGSDAVIYPNRRIQFRFDDALRDDSSGVYVGQPQEYRGAVGGFMLPPAGDGNLTSRVAVMARRNDIETADAASVSDATSVQVNWWPRWYSVPA